jgi:hypothetical protein
LQPLNFWVARYLTNWITSLQLARTAREEFHRRIRSEYETEAETHFATFLLVSAISFENTCPRSFFCALQRIPTETVRGHGSTATGVESGVAWYCISCFV